jgi:hypothetical protein
MINTSFAVINITEILNRELVGKTYRYCGYHKDIMQPFFVIKKKQGATNKQFEDNPKKFGFSLMREKKIGTHTKFEESKIKRIWLDNGNYEGYDEIMAELENGLIITLPVK